MDRHHTPDASAQKLAQMRAEYEDLQRHGKNTAHNLARMQAALEETASRSADYLRKAIKAEAEVALLRAALNGGNVIERLRADAERYRWIAAHCRSTAEHWGGRWSIVVEGPAPTRHDEEDAFDAAIDAARAALEKP